MSLYEGNGFQEWFRQGFNLIHDYNIISAKVQQPVNYKQGGDYWQNGQNKQFTYRSIELNFQGKSPRSYQLLKQGIVKEGVTVYSIYIKGSQSVDAKDRIVIDSDSNADPSIYGTYKIVNDGGDGVIQGGFIFKTFDCVLV